MTGRLARDPAERAYRGAVEAWASTLRSGSTTSWAAWLVSAPEASDATPAGGPRALDATHLEVVRRLNLAGASPGDPALADLVLATPAPGRGMLEPPLVFPGREPTIGTRPWDPELVPADELLRVAAAVLVRLLARLVPRQDAPGSAPDAGGEPVTTGARLRRGLARRGRAVVRRSAARLDRRSADSVPGPRERVGPPGFEVHGSPGLAGETAARLLAAGAHRGGPDAVHLVLAGPLDRMLVDLWQLKTEEGTGVRWERFCDHVAAQRQLPRRLSPAALAATAARRRGPERVHVLLVRDADEAARLAAPLLGLPPPAPGAVGAVLTPPDGSVADLLRRTDLMLDASVREAERAAYQQALRRLVARAAADGDRPPSSPALHLPEGVLPWAQQAAARLDADLRAGARAAGYTVHGGGAVVMPATGEDLARAVDAEQTLALALAVCAAAWREATDPDPNPDRAHDSAHAGATPRERSA